MIVFIQQLTARKYDISAMPTFGFFRNGSLVDKFVGANPSGLEQKLKSLLGKNWKMESIIFKVHLPLLFLPVLHLRIVLHPNFSILYELSFFIIPRKVTTC